MAWEPGQSGNPEGSKERAAFIRCLNRAIAQDDGKRLRGAVEKLLDLADQGEQWAVQMLADRLDGRPAQAVAVTGADGGPFVMTWAMPGEQPIVASVASVARGELGDASS